MERLTAVVASFLHRKSQQPAASALGLLRHTRCQRRRCASCRQEQASELEPAPAPPRMLMSTDSEVATHRTLEQVRALQPRHLTRGLRLEGRPHLVKITPRARGCSLCVLSLRCSPVVRPAHLKSAVSVRDQRSPSARGLGTGLALDRRSGQQPHQQARHKVRNTPWPTRGPACGEVAAMDAAPATLQQSGPWRTSLPARSSSLIVLRQRAQKAPFSSWCVCPARCLHPTDCNDSRAQAKRLGNCKIGSSIVVELGRQTLPSKVGSFSGARGGHKAAARQSSRGREGLRGAQAHATIAGQQVQRVRLVFGCGANGVCTGGSLQQLWLLAIITAR